MYAALIGLLASTPVILASPTLKVLPEPTTYTSGDQVVCLSSSFSITVSGDGVPQDVYDAVGRTAKALKETSHTWLSPTAGADFFSSSNGACSNTLDSLTLCYDGVNGTIASIFEEATQGVDGRIDLEEYTLWVPAGGEATLKAKNSLGLFRGLATFQQLFYLLPGSGPDSNNDQQSFAARDSVGPRNNGNDDAQTAGCKGTVYTPNAPVQITDKPAFPWRSFMLDTARYYFSKSSILRQLDAMALVKLSVFHWHITDGQSWPMKLDAYPELAEGAYSPSMIYTQEDIKEIIQYAGERGIDVVVEMDTPAHTTSIGASHPDYIACAGKESPKYSNEPPTGQLRFANETVTQFAVDLFKATADVTSSKYLGTGGDELNTKCMNEDEPTTALLKQNGWTLEDALDQFTNATHNGLREVGRTPVVWQEMVLKHNLTTVAKDVVVNVWISSTDAKLIVDKGYRIVHASSDFFYLDCGEGGWFGGMLDSWCDPYKSWWRIYTFDPYKDIPAEQYGQVLGGQVSLWTEQSDEANLEPMVWPRAAALAEILWSGGKEGGQSGGQSSFPRNGTMALGRMHDIRYRLVSTGIRAVPIQPHWCALREGLCN